MKQIKMLKYTLLLVLSVCLSQPLSAGIGWLIPLITLTPAGIGGYNTYKTLMDEKTFIGNSYNNFSRAMDRANPQHVSTGLKAVCSNFSKYFNPQEKMAIVGSSIATVLGAASIVGGAVGYLLAVYKCYRANNQQDKAYYKRHLTWSLCMIATGLIATTVGGTSLALLADYAESGQV